MDRLELERSLSLMNQAVAASGMPTPPPPAVDSVFSGRKVSSIPSNHPKLDLPRQLSNQEIQSAASDLESFFKDENGNSIDIGDLLHKILLIFTEETTDRLVTQRQWLNLERQWMQDLEEKRTHVFDKHIAGQHTAHSWSTVAKALSSFGLLATGVAGLAAGTATVIASGIAIASVVTGACLVLDQLLDDKAKKLVASWIARGDKERQEVWVDRIHFFCGAACCALSLGLNPKTAIEIAMNVSRTALTAGQTITEFRTSRHRALIIELDAACRIQQRELQNKVSELQETCNSIYQYYENIHHIEDMQSRLSRQMLQFGDLHA